MGFWRIEKRGKIVGGEDLPRRKEGGLGRKCWVAAMDSSFFSSFFLGEAFVGERVDELYRLLSVTLSLGPR